MYRIFLLDGFLLRRSKHISVWHPFQFHRITPVARISCQGVCGTYFDSFLSKIMTIRFWKGLQIVNVIHVGFLSAALQVYKMIKIFVVVFSRDTYFKAEVSSLGNCNTGGLQLPELAG